MRQLVIYDRAARSSLVGFTVAATLNGHLPPSAAPGSEVCMEMGGGVGTNQCGQRASLAPMHM